MKVLEVIQSLDIGGAERALEQRLRYLPGHIDTVVLHGPARTGLQVSLPSTVRTIEDALSHRTLERVIASESPGVVVIHNPLTLIRYPRHLAQQLAPLVVYLAHASVLSDDRWKSRLITIPFRLSLSKATRILAVSRQAGTQVGSRHEFDVVHLGSTLSESPLEETQQENFEWLQAAKFRFLVLSRLSSTKNVKGLLKAISGVQQSFRDSEARLLVVGDGPEKEGLLKLVSPLGIDDLVRFSPTTNSPAEFLRNTDYLVISSFSEGGPLTAYEALLAGCRLVATPVGVVPDIAEAFPGQVIVAQGHHSNAFGLALQMALTGGRRKSRPLQDNASARLLVSTQSCSRDFYDQIQSPAGPGQLA